MFEKSQCHTQKVTDTQLEIWFNLEAHQSNINKKILKSTPPISHIKFSLLATRSATNCENGHIMERAEVWKVNNPDDVIVMSSGLSRLGLKDYKCITESLRYRLGLEYDVGIYQTGRF